jgi:hypothetical protein
MLEKQVLLRRLFALWDWGANRNSATCDFRSLRNGCTTVVTRSTGAEHEIYEFLYDLSVSCQL